MGIGARISHAHSPEKKSNHPCPWECCGTTLSIMVSCVHLPNFGTEWLLLHCIGYGCQIPRTTAGRLISLPYAVVGIPLTFYFLSRAGRDLARFLETVYRRVCCDVVCCKICQRRRRRQIYSPGGAGRRGVIYHQSPDGASYVADSKCCYRTV